jgi:hypothetical protein
MLSFNKSSSILILITTIIIEIISCKTSNSHGPNSDKLVGNWKYDNLSFSKPEYNLVIDNLLTLGKDGVGKMVNISVTEFTNKDLGYDSTTIEFPLNWKTEKYMDEFCLILSYGKGKIIHIQSNDIMQQEEVANYFIKGLSGDIDTICFEMDGDEPTNWRKPRDPWDFFMQKR